MFTALLPVSASAKTGVEYQMALGNPSSAVTAAAERTNYLIARDQYALSYNDDTHQANWVSWSFTAADDRSASRTDAWAVESALPTGYLKIGPRGNFVILKAQNALEAPDGSRCR